MSTDGSKAAGAARGGRSAGAARGGSSVYSVGTSIRKNRNTIREEMIAKKITEIFKEKENRMIRTIEQTIIEDKLRIYKHKRSFYDVEFQELEAERKKILKKKKSKKERAKLLKANTKAQFIFIVRALNATVLHYKELYYENDYYRYKRLLDVQAVTADADEKAKNRALLEQLNQFFQSPFKNDKRFTIFHLAQLTRDRIDQSRELINALFFDKIFRLLLNTSDERNKLKAFEILCNLIHSQVHRKRLAQQGYFKQVYDTMRIGYVDDKILEKLSWMTTLICFHPDMIDQIIHLRLLAFIIKLVEPKFPAAIRSNAVLAISLLTYHEQLFDELISNGVIDLVMNLCMDVNGDLQVKQFSTLALVHFALSKQSINILIQKGIMDLFNSLGVIENVQIQTNVSWIFLALCNNGITGRQMLINGITRDMFLVSCNPQFHQIRHLVIAGFAELGRCTELRDSLKNQKGKSLQRIKEKAIVGMHTCFKEDALTTINILLTFTISENLKFVITAFWALKDYILLNHDCLINDLSGVIWAFVNGSAEDSEQVKIECANAISFLITHHLVFNKEEFEIKKQIQRGPDEHSTGYKAEQNYVLDALMLLTASESLQVRTRAFSTLSTLSTYASQDEHVMSQIQADIAMVEGKISRQYYEFILDRLKQSREHFIMKYQTVKIEETYAGLYCLLRLAQDPTELAAQEAATYLHKFYYPDHYKNIRCESQFDQSESEKKNDESMKSQSIEQAIEEKNKGDKQFFDNALTAADKKRLSVCLDQPEDLGEFQMIEPKDLDPLNEKFFMFVFESLLYTKNQRILYQLLDIVNFYIKNKTQYQSKVINAQIILWMLEILCKQGKDDQELSLLAAKTILRVVDNHQIIFDYQEMAIIKKFNKALDNCDTRTLVNKAKQNSVSQDNRDDSSSNSDSDREQPNQHGDQDHQDNLQGEQKSISKKSTQSEAQMKDQVRQQLEKELSGQHDTRISIEQQQNIENKSDFCKQVPQDDELIEIMNGKGADDWDRPKSAIAEGEWSPKHADVLSKSNIEQHDPNSIIVKDNQSSFVKGSMAHGAEQKTLSDFKADEGDQGSMHSKAKSNTGEVQNQPSQDMSVNNVSRIEIQDGPKDISDAEKSRTDDQQKPQAVSSNTSVLQEKSQINLEKSKSSASNNFHQKNLDMELVRGESHSINLDDKSKVNEAAVSETGQQLDTAKFNLDKEGQLLRDRGEDAQQSDRNQNQRSKVQGEITSGCLDIKKPTSARNAVSQKKRGDQSPNTKSIAVTSCNPSANPALRDALIKSFMVIFTNEKSQHLLLNKDIIEIAFNCLEFCESISVEAKRNLARLISIIFKFPQVQERILQTKIINGVVHLLCQDSSQKSILSHAVRSCTYISLGYSFVNSPLSLSLLKALVPLMDVLPSQLDNEAKEAQQANISRTKQAIDNSSGTASPSDQPTSTYVDQMSQAMKPEFRSDRDNCLFSISNILKGHSKNSFYFIQSNGPARVMLGLLKLLDSNDATIVHKQNVIELCVGSIKQLSNSKQTFKEFLEYSEENRTLLPKVLKRCFLLSDAWHQSTRELLRFNKIFNSNDNQKRQPHKLDSQDILKLNFENVESFKALELLEQQEDMAVRMAPIVKIRNNVLYTAVGCFKARFMTDYLIEECALLERLVSDLERDSINDYLFQHLILLMQSLQKDHKAVEKLILKYQERLFALFEKSQNGNGIQQVDKKITLIKTVVQLVLRIPEQICDSNAKVFGRLFALAIHCDVANQEEKDEIIDSILWLQSTLMQLQSEGPQLQKAIKLCLDLKSAEIFVACLASSNERIVLQALKGLSTMAGLPEFRPTLLIDQGDKLFAALADILTKRVKTQFKQLQLEIETELCNTLALVTSSGQASKDPLTVAARRRVVQQGFVDCLLRRASTLGYKVCDEDTDMNDQLLASGFNDTSMHLTAAMGGTEKDGGVTQLMCSSELSQILEQKTPFDDVNKCHNGNQFVEHLFRLLSHVTELTENHKLLLSEKTNLIPTIVEVANKFLEYATINAEQVAMDQEYGQESPTRVGEMNSEHEGVRSNGGGPNSSGSPGQKPVLEPLQMIELSFGNLQAGKSIGRIFTNLCSGEGGSASQSICVDQGLAQASIKMLQNLADFELHVFLSKALASLVLSTDGALAQRVTELGVLQQLIGQCEDSQFFKVKRISQSAVDSTREELIELNERMMKRQLRMQRTRSNTLRLQS